MNYLCAKDLNIYPHYYFSSMSYDYRNTWISRDLDNEINAMQQRLSKLFGRTSRIEATRVIAWKSRHHRATPNDSDLIKIMRGIMR